MHYYPVINTLVGSSFKNLWCIYFMLKQTVLNKLNFLVSEIVSMLCGKSDQEIILATLNGEARGESLEGQKAVRNVIKNRTTGPKYFRANDKLGYNGSNKEVQVCLAPYQFSVWNVITTCTAFLAQYNKVMRRPTITEIPEVDYSVFTQGTGLTVDQAKKVYLYCNPATATSTDKWVTLTKQQSAANPNKKTWSIKTKFDGVNEITITFIRIGRHVFIHGLQ